MDSVEGKGGFFEQLERHSVQLSPAADLGLRRDRWWILLIVAGVLLTLLPLARMTGWAWMQWLPVLGLVMQVIGLGVFSWRQLRDVVPDFIDAKRKFAREMDAHFLQRQTVLQWLRSIPALELKARLAYIEVRLETLRSRYVLIFGAVDKLGVLPVIVAVFIQIQGLKSMSLWLMLMGVGITVLYAMALWVCGFRLQMEGYVRLIRAATVPGPDEANLGHGSSGSRA